MKLTSLVVCLLASPVAAQTLPVPAAGTGAPESPGFEFSGVLFANFQYRGDRLGRAANRFDVERAYLTFQTPVHDQLAVRVTADVFQQLNSGSDSFYRGWVIRAKYAYLQYNFLDRAGWRALARGGLIQTVFIEHDDRTWQRWLSTNPTERAGYFSSADAGVAASLSLPQKLGELYLTVTNGGGYTTRELDRFKDYAARFTLSPWARDTASGLGSVTFAAWGYRGRAASRFVDGGAGQMDAVGSGLARNRLGAHVAASRPAFTLVAQYARRVDETETGSNTTASPRAVSDSTGTLLSGYAIIRPFLRGGPLGALPLSVVARTDRVTPDHEPEASYNVVIAGLVWDLGKNVSVSLDYQETTPVERNPVVPVKTYFAHLVARY